MQEMIGQVQAHLRGFWRYRWAAMAFAWVLALVAWGYGYRIPDQYQASARVHVDTESMLRPLLRGMVVDSNTQRRVQLMTRTLLARPNLEKIARKTDLDLQARGPREMDRLLGRLEERIRLKGTERTNLYTVSYTGPDPRQAKKVVQAVVSLFVEKSLGQSREDTESAQAFLDRKIKEYEARLERAEERLMEFKRKHTGEMPGERGDYYARLQDKMAKLEKARFQLRTARRRKQELEKQLKGEEPVFGIMGDSGSPGGGGTSRLDQRIAGLQKQLDQLLLKYTQKHPEVVALKDTIQRLKNRREQKRRRLAKQAGQTSPGAASALDQNPVYQEIKASLAQARAEVAAARARVGQYRQQVKELKGKVDTIPKVEAKLAQLTRDYKVNKETYQKLLQRRQSAEISEEVESSSSQVQFKVVDPARVPTEPVSPNRPLLLSAGFGGALLGGAALGVFFSLLWPAFYNRASLYETTNIPVLGAVHRVATPAYRRRRLLELSAYGGAGLGLALVFGVALALVSEREAVLASAQGLVSSATGVIPGGGGVL